MTREEMEKISIWIEKVARAERTAHEEGNIELEYAAGIVLHTLITVSTTFGVDP